jgi:hypothetical protein
MDSPAVHRTGRRGEGCSCRCDVQKQETFFFVKPDRSRQNCNSRNRPTIIWSKWKHAVLAYLIYTTALGHHSRSLMAFCALEGSGDDPVFDVQAEYALRCGYFWNLMECIEFNPPSFPFCGFETRNVNYSIHVQFSAPLKTVCYPTCCSRTAACTQILLSSVPVSIIIIVITKNVSTFRVRFFQFLFLCSD